MTRLRFLIVAALVVMSGGCQLLNQGLPPNTISFNLDGTDYSYSASSGPSTHAWGRGTVYSSTPPSEYLLTASASAADADDLTRTVDVQFSEDGDYSMIATVYTATGAQYSFYLGAADYNLLAHMVVNLDAEGEQMWGAFPGTYKFADGSVHTLKNLVFSVERLADYYPAF